MSDAEPSALDIAVLPEEPLVLLLARVASEFSLSYRETEVLTAAAKGRSTKEIASELAVSRKTVEYYWARLYNKLRCRSQLEAIAMLLKRTLATPMASTVSIPAAKQTKKLKYRRIVRRQGCQDVQGSRFATVRIQSR